ncbi:hypothetical protein ACKKBF_B37285 [Auxenochlorella protothecoides x Auxenochlorella symbiontica]
MDLRLVHRLKGVVQLAFPVAVVLDTLHSLWRVRQLAAAQLKEWEAEEDREVLESVVPKFHRMIRRCRREEGELWLGVAHALGSSGHLPMSEHGPVRGSGSPIPAAFPPIPHTIHGAGPAAPSASTAPAAGLEHAPAASTRPPTPMHDGPTEAPPAGVEYVTLEDAWAHTVSRLVPKLPDTVEYVTLSDACSLGMELATGAHSQSPLALRAARRLSRRVANKGSEAADAALDALRARLPWPQAVLTRRSALRWSLEWHGVRRPGQAGRQPLERDLSSHA